MMAKVETPACWKQERLDRFAAAALIGLVTAQAQSSTDFESGTVTQLAHRAWFMGFRMLAVEELDTADNAG
jgi:hypothetical protein